MAGPAAPRPLIPPGYAGPGVPALQTSTTPSSPTAVQSWSTAETLNANNCANARNVW